MHRTLLNMSRMERELGVNLMTPELRIIGHLLANGPVPSQKLLACAGVSPAGFHIVKNRLIGQRLIVGIKSAEDRRQTLYDLTAAVRARMMPPVDHLLAAPG